MDPNMMGGGMPGHQPADPNMPLDPNMLAMMLGGMGGAGAPSMGAQTAGGGFGDDGGGLSPMTGGTTSMTIPGGQPIPDGSPLAGPDSSSLLQALMAMSQGGVPMSGQSPVGGMY